MAAAGASIREIRQENGLSQEQLAMDAGIDQSTLSKIERIGPHVTSWRTLFAILDVLGCEATILISKLEDIEVRPRHL